MSPSPPIRAVKGRVQCFNPNFLLITPDIFVLGHLDARCVFRPSSQNKKKRYVLLSPCTSFLVINDLLDSNPWSSGFPVADDNTFPAQGCVLLECHRALQLAAGLLHSWCSAWKLSLSLTHIPNRRLGRPGPDRIQKGPRTLRFGSVDVVGGLVVVRASACM